MVGRLKNTILVSHLAVHLTALGRHSSKVNGKILAQILVCQKIFLLEFNFASDMPNLEPKYHRLILGQYRGIIDILSTFSLRNWQHMSENFNCFYTYYL